MFELGIWKAIQNSIPPKLLNLPFRSSFELLYFLYKNTFVNQYVIQCGFFFFKCHGSPSLVPKIILWSPDPHQVIFGDLQDWCDAWGNRFSCMQGMQLKPHSFLPDSKEPLCTTLKMGMFNSLPLVRKLSLIAIVMPGARFVCLLLC